MNIDLKQTFALLILSWMAAVAGCTSIPQLSSTEPATAIRCRMHETADPRNGAKEIHTSYILGDPAGGDHDLFFATLTDFPSGPEELYAEIVRKKDGRWQIADFRSHDPERILQQCGWVYVGYCVSRREIWGVLDCVVEDGGWELYLIRSQDGGDSWDLVSVIPKIRYTAHCKGFTMAADGQGTLSIVVWDDASNTPPGLYTYATSDGGLTWRGPVFTLDYMEEAQHLPEYPQHDPLTEAQKN